MEDRSAEIMKGLEDAGLLALFSPALVAKMNHAGLSRFEKALGLLPDDARWRAARFGTFLYALTEKLSPKDKAALIKTTEMPKGDVAEWQKLDAKAKKLETALKAARIRKASQVYHIVSVASPEEVLFTLYHSTAKPVQERLRNHFEKYVQQIAEITQEEWDSIPVKPGTPKYAKARDAFITQRLDRRVKKVVEEPPPTAPPAPEPVMGRRGIR